VVDATERALAMYPGCGSVQVISIGIYHPSGFKGPVRDSHLEDVAEFRKGPDQKFSVHVPGEAPRRTL
jgi:hypothetical protein